jgi:Domain of unknown function (DUF222)
LGLWTTAELSAVAASIVHVFDMQIVERMPPGAELGHVLASVDLGELGADQTLTYLAASDRQIAWNEARRVEALGHFADLHATVPDATVPGMARLAPTGGDGAPEIDEFAVDEYAAAIGVTRGSAHGHLAVAMDLRHRLPQTYAALGRGEIAMWRARMVAEQTRRLDRQAAADVDAQLADKLPRLGWRRLRDAVEAAAIDADPVGAEKAAEQAKPDRGVDVHPDDDHGLKRMGVTAEAADVIRFDAAVDYVADLLGKLGDGDPKAERRAKAIGVLANPHHALALQQAVRDGATTPPPWADAMVYVHFTRDQWESTRDGATTLEGAGPITAGRARDLLGHSHVTIRPVIDLEGMPTSDDRFARGRFRESVILKTSDCPFPSCCSDARRGQIDHTIPTPRGPTHLGNLSPPCTPHHRTKTHGGWSLAQPVNGVYLWRSPTGRMYLVDRAGITHPVHWHTES